MESICWTYNTPPSKLRPILWTNSRNDVMTMVRLKSMEKQAGFVQEFQTLADIASQIFGGSKKNVPPKNVMRPQSSAELSSAFRKVLGFG